MNLSGTHQKRLQCTEATGRERLFPSVFVLVYLCCFLRLAFAQIACSCTKTCLKSSARSLPRRWISWNLATGWTPPQPKGRWSTRKLWKRYVMRDSYFDFVRDWPRPSIHSRPSTHPPIQPPIHPSFSTSSSSNHTCNASSQSVVRSAEGLTARNVSQSIQSINQSINHEMWKSFGIWLYWRNSIREAEVPGCMLFYERQEKTWLFIQSINQSITRNQTINRSIDQSIKLSISLVFHQTKHFFFSFYTSLRLNATYRTRCHVAPKFCGAGHATRLAGTSSSLPSWLTSPKTCWSASRRPSGPWRRLSSEQTDRGWLGRVSFSRSFPANSFSSRTGTRRSCREGEDGTKGRRERSCCDFYCGLLASSLWTCRRFLSRFKTEEEVITLANCTTSGLAGEIIKQCVSTCLADSLDIGINLVHPEITFKARLHMRFLMRFLMRFRVQNAPYPTLHECFFREASCGLERKLSHIVPRHPSFQFLLTWWYFVAALRD